MRLRIVLPKVSPEAVQRLTVVDNSDYSLDGLTVQETRRILASQGALPSPHFKQRGFVWPFTCSCSCVE